MSGFRSLAAPLILALSICQLLPVSSFFTGTYPASAADSRFATIRDTDGQSRENLSGEKNVRHLLNRITYGPAPGDIDRVQSQGIKHFIEEQLNPDGLKEADPVLKAMSGPAVSKSCVELFMTYGRPVLQGQNKTASTKEEREALQKAIHKTYKDLYQQSCAARLSRAIDSPRQLEALMTEFWFNHFNVYFNKGLDNIWVGSYESSAIRPNALGKFRTLLGATAHHPAMLFYLDNWQNSAPAGAENGRSNNGFGPGKQKQGKRFGGLNENYARELMELHTLGVDGGYTQKDVVELARILTGLGLPNRQALVRQARNFRSGGAEAVKIARQEGWHFDASRHDMGDKVLLGKTIKGQGEKEIEEALDLLSRHKSTARFISFKLVQFFVADEPPKDLVDRVAARFTATDGDIKEMLRTIFQSPEFWDEKYMNNKFKSPYRYALSALRASSCRVDNYVPVLSFFRQTGMPLYGCVTPDGYKCTKAAWLSPDSIVQRINMATALSSGRVPGIHPEVQSYRQVIYETLESPPARTMQSIESAPGQLRLALVLGSPEFMMY